MATETHGRGNFTLRMSRAGRASISALADDTHTDESKVIRAFLAVGLGDPNQVRKVRERLLRDQEI
jgi:hypothetical protein